MNKRFLTLTDIENSGDRGSVWVLNNAHASDVTSHDGSPLQSAKILISVPNVNGPGGSPLVIDQTWLPLDAASFFQKNRLLASSDFRKAVSTNLLRLISDEYAAELLEQEGAEEERQRLIHKRRHVAQAGASRKISKELVEVFIPDSNGRPEKENENEDEDVQVYGPDSYEEENTAAIIAASANSVDEDGLRPSFKMFAEKLVSESDITTLNAIRSRAKFTRKEIRYLIDTIKNKPKTLAALKERVSKVKKAA